MSHIALATLDLLALSETHVCLLTAIAWTVFLVWLCLAVVSLRVRLKQHKHSKIFSVCFAYKPWRLRKIKHSMLLGIFSSFRSLPSMENSSPRLQNFLRTFFWNISSPTWDFTVAICSKHIHIDTFRTFCGSNVCRHRNNQLGWKDDLWPKGC